MSNEPIMKAISPRAWDNKSGLLIFSGLIFFAYVTYSIILPYALSSILYNNSSRTTFEWSMVIAGFGWIIFGLTFMAFISISSFTAYLYSPPLVVYDDGYRRIGYEPIDEKRWIRFDEIKRAVIFKNKKREFKKRDWEDGPNVTTVLVDYLIIGIELKAGFRHIISEVDIGHHAIFDFIKVLETKGIPVLKADEPDLSNGQCPDLTYFLVENVQGDKDDRDPVEIEKENEKKLQEKIIRHIYFDDNNPSRRKTSIAFFLASLPWWPSIFFYPWNNPLSQLGFLFVAFTGAILFMVGCLMFVRKTEFIEPLFTPTGIHLVVMSKNREILAVRAFISYKDIKNLRTAGTYGTDIIITAIDNKVHTIHSSLTTKYWILIAILKETKFSGEDVNHALNKIISYLFIMKN